MVTLSNPRDHEAIRSILARMSAAWREGRLEDLSVFFDEHAVIVAPRFHARIKGREACVDSYRDFFAHANVVDYDELEPTIDIWGDTAVSSYEWRMVWESHGQVSSDEGHDLLVFARTNQEWRVVWRTLVSAPTSNGG